MSPHTHELPTFGALLLGACLGVACSDAADPAAQDVEFKEGSAVLRDAGMLEPADHFDWSGHYLLALSTVLAPDRPLLFAVDAEVASDLALVDLRIQPLTTDADSDPRTPAGDPLSVDDVPYAEDGTLEFNFEGVAVQGRANPITGSDIAAQVMLHAGTYKAEGAVPQHVCGDASGMVSEPIPLDLSGSTFGAVLTEDEKQAEPMLHCP